MEVNENNKFKEEDLNIVTEWLIKFQSNTLLESDFCNYWKIWVPRIIKLKRKSIPLEWSFNEQKAEKMLFNTLEKFIFSGNSIEVLRGFTQQNYTPSVCGKVLEINEPAYNCRECEMDPTCVLCVDCFKQSQHKNHKYKIRTSHGGGRCDCGDIEAWKQDAYCQTHKIGLEKNHVNLNCLTNDMEKRAHLVFQYVLCYARAILVSEKSPVSPVKLDSDEELDDLYSIYRNQDDSFCVVMYNDKKHTFSEFLTVLHIFGICKLRESLNYVISVNREGRAVVKCDGFRQCNYLKKKIEKFTSQSGVRHLKILIVHSHVIAHQIYALRLLSWMQNLLRYSERIRAIFSKVVLANIPSEECIVESILRKNTTIWKSARLHWHKLFVAGMFKEYTNKKEFAKVFIKNYDTIMKNFIYDDLDDSYSVVSLGVEIFTVPALANYLVHHHDALNQLLNIFLSECLQKINKQGKLEFKPNISIVTFNRAQYILKDVHHLLGCVPKSWNPELRELFFHAVSLVLNIFNYMQNMDTIIRQETEEVDVDVERKWENAFNLHIKFKPLITKILLWCGSDKTVLKKVYSMTLTKILENPVLDPIRPTVVRELEEYKVSYLDHDVLIESVSLHLPLSRFLANLHSYIHRIGLNIDISELQAVKQYPEQIIEPVLRVLVSISQLRVGMWDPNKFLFFDQINFYLSPKYRTEMLDKDIVLLQIGASLMGSNEFLIHVLNKFNLLKWAEPNFEQDILNESKDESVCQTVMLVEEFLALIITVVSERYTPGVGKVTLEDCIKKEIIQQLCLKPMPHSELNGILINFIDNEACLEKIINEVAVFKKTPEKGVYELKPAYYDDYDVFYYHYSKEDIFKSEEEQKKRRKAANKLECCPPPSLPLFSDAFANISNILKCDIMFYVMNLILNRTVNVRSRSFSGLQLHQVLHFIGYALHEEEMQRTTSFSFTERAKSYGIEVALEVLQRSPRVEAYKDLALWTLNKFKQISRRRRLSIKTQVSDDIESIKSKDAELEKQKRAQLAAERRTSVMAQIALIQNNFIKNNATLFESTPTHLETRHDSTSINISENIGKLSVALGPCETSSSIDANKVTCILCHEQQFVTHDGQVMVLATFVQKSSVLCQIKSISESAIDHASDPYYIPANFGPSPHVSTCGHVMHVACWQKHYEVNKEGNIMNILRIDLENFEYLCPLCERLCNATMPLLPPMSSFKKPENMKSFQNLTFDSWLEGLKMILKQCKVVKSKTSKNLPKSVINQQTTSSEPEQKLTRPKIEAALHKLKIVPNVVCNNIAQSEEEVSSSPYQFSMQTNDFNTEILMFDELKPIATPDVSVYKNGEFSTSLVDTLLQFTKTLGYNNPQLKNNQIPLITLKACAYTIHSNEVILRYKNKPLFGDLSNRQKDCLEALVRVSGTLGSTWEKEHEINLHTLRLLSIAIDNGGNNSIGILDWDAFGMLFSLTMTLPSLYYIGIRSSAPKKSLLDFHTLNLMFIAHLVQIILTINIEEDYDEILIIESKENYDTHCIAELVYKLRGFRVYNTIAVWKVIKSCAIPFLRCCSLFYHFFTGVPPLSVLTEVNGDTYHNMCCYLELPTTCKELLDQPFVQRLIDKWSENDKVIKIKRGETIAFRSWTHINELVKLPDDYSELINSSSMFTCPSSNHENLTEPAMCLVCGTIICSRSFCCLSEIKNSLVSNRLQILFN